MKYLSLCLLLLWLIAPTQAEPRPFTPADRSFRITVPGRVQSVEQEDDRFIWGSDDGRCSYLFGYSVIARAASMPESELRPALGQFLTNYESNAKVSERSRTPLTLSGHVGLDAAGVGIYGDSWVRVLAVGPRIYILATDGTSAKEHRTFCDSFKLRPASPHH